ncbi:hypothetical protein GCM10010504_00990 [Streptomyces griseus]|nr:hypothetical protein GCM10010504_00990 [Streptomyces griseus]
MGLYRARVGLPTVRGVVRRRRRVAVGEVFGGLPGNVLQGLAAPDRGLRSDRRTADMPCPTCFCQGSAAAVKGVDGNLEDTRM